MPSCNASWIMLLPLKRADENRAIRLPGHEFTTLLAENRRNGITVDDSVWAKSGRYKEISHDFWTYRAA